MKSRKHHVRITGLPALAPKEYDEYYCIFVEQNGSDSAKKLINIDEDEVLVRKVDRLLKIRKS